MTELVPMRRPVPPEEALRYKADGWWTDETLGERLFAGLRDNSSNRFVAHSLARPWAGTFADVLDLSRRVAAGLEAHGVGPGSVVSFQIPNWVEAAATFYAAAMVGAAVVPIVHFYGAREVGYILRQATPRVHVSAASFGHNDYVSMLEGLDTSATDVAVIGDSSWDELADHPPIDAPRRTDPDAPALIGYTSGTTANPKGVVHSHRTIGAEMRQLGDAQPTEVSLPPLVGSPVGHATGMLSALLLPVRLGKPIHLIDVWDPGRVLATILEHDLSLGGGATFFLVSVLDHPDFRAEHLARMKYAGMGGAAIPRAVAERATDLGITVYRMYGSTEQPSITGCTWRDPLDKRIATDGRPLPGNRIRLVSEGVDVPVGDAGEIWSMGPDLCLGYTDPALTEAAFDADGWYHTGDIAIADDDGYIVITDRKNDVIIRGGENISAAEIEELLLRMPGVAEVAVVAAPDARMGEHAAAFVRMREAGAVPALDEVRAAMQAGGLARQKWPEEILAIEDFPRTASGKVQKFVLRDRLRSR